MKRIYPYRFVLLFCCLIFKLGVAQDKVFYTTVIAEENVDVAFNSVDGNLSSNAVIRANSGLAFGIGAYTGSLELEANAYIPANTTTYIKINTEENILESLLAGSLANLTADVIGTVLLGSQEFTVKAKLDGTTLLEGSSNNLNDFAGPNLKLVVNSDNEFLIAVTPTTTYNQIEITNRTGSLIGLNTEISLDVFEAYYFEEDDNCATEVYTSWSGNSLTIDAFNVSGASALNLDLAVDGDDQTFSKLGLGFLGVLGSIEQKFHFGSTVQESEEIVLKFQMDPALLSLGFLNNIELVLENEDNTEVVISLSGLISSELLDKLQNGETIEVRIKPTIGLDSLSLKLNSLLNVTVDQNIRIVAVERVLSAPVLDISVSDLVVCEGSSASLSAAISANTTILWHDAEVGGNLLASTNNTEVFNSPVLNSNTTFYAQAQSVECGTLSERVAVAIEVIPLPNASDIIVDGTVDALCNNTSNIVLSPSSSLSALFMWYLDANMNVQITDGLTQNGITYSIAANGELTVVGLTEANSPYTYFINVAESVLGCSIPAGSLKEVKVEVVASTYDASVTSDFVLNNTNISARLNANDTVEITGTVQGDAQVGDLLTLIIDGVSFSGTVASDLSFSILVDGALLFNDNDQNIDVLIESNAESCSVADDIPIVLDTISVLEYVQEFCASDNPTIEDLDVNNDDVVWFNSPTELLELANDTPLEDGADYFFGLSGIPTTILERGVMTVEFIDVPLPTTRAVNQVFCVFDQPTVADFQVNGEQVVIYDSENGNTVLDSTEPLYDGMVCYAANIVGECESEDRLALSVVMTQPEALEDELIQTFCTSDSPVVGDITLDSDDFLLFNMENLTALAESDTPLEDGQVFVAAIFSDVCEITDQVQIRVVLLDPDTPTTEESNQTFCESENAMVADLQVKEDNIVWYDADTEGNRLNETDLIEDGKSYFAARLVSSCESQERLKVDAAIISSDSATIEGEFEEACLNSTETYTTESGMQDYEWTVTGGIVVDGGTSMDDFVSVNWNTEENTSLSVTYTEGRCGTNVTTTTNVNVTSCVLSASFGVEVFSLFSPNNDGFNDEFMVRGGEEFNRILKIYNRYGKLVYQSNNYQSDWDGISNVNNVVQAGEALPSGTYYYVIEISYMNVNMNGWVQLAR